MTSFTWKYVPLSGKLPLIAVLQGICKNLQHIILYKHTKIPQVYTAAKEFEAVTYQDCPSNSLRSRFFDAVA